MKKAKRPKVASTLGELGVGDTCQTYVVIDGRIYTLRLQRTGTVNGSVLVRFDAVVLDASTPAHKHEPYEQRHTVEQDADTDPLK